jgi:hypothetical protein
VSPIASASSTARLSGTALPPRIDSSAVTMSLALASSMRSNRLFAEKPPNTTEWMAPMRAQACIATTASTLIGM